MQDLRFAFRSLRKSPGFTVTVVIILALGIGASTTVFSVVNSLLLHPITYPEPERLLTLRETRLPEFPDGRVSVPDFLDWKNQAHSFAAMAGFSYTSLNLTGESEPLRLNAQRITANYFDVIGVKLLLGRAFLPEEETPGKNRVVILSHSFWRDIMGGAPDAIGRTVQLNGESYTVVGVSRENLEQTGDRPLGGSYISVPLVYSDAEKTNRSFWLLNVQARLKPGVTVAQAQAEMDVITRRLAEQYPETNKGGGALVMRAGDYQTRRISPALWSLLGAVGCVLLIACANVANLMLARATVRQREMSVRAALGAGRSRLIRQLLVESLLLALIGGAGGVLLSFWGLAALRTFPFGGTPGLLRLATIQPDFALLAFALILSVATGLIFGLAPAWLAARVDLNEALKQGTRGSTEGGSRGRLRGMLIVCEVACALVLLSSAGLLMRSFIKLAHVDPGFEPDRVTSFQLFLRGEKYANGLFPKPEPVRTFSDELLARLRTLPGVEAAGVTCSLPMIDRPFVRPFEIDGRTPLAPGDRPFTHWTFASPSYFETMGIRLLRGRPFSVQDNAKSPPVALINDTLARDYFPNQDPVGQRIKIDSGANAGGWCEIVGVVADVSPALDQVMPPQVYEPFAQKSTTQLSFVVRTSSDPAAIVSSLKPLVYAVDPNLPVAFVRLLSDVVDRSIALPRFTIRLLGLFSSIALVIAAVGVYGVIAYTVGQRTTEFGIRMALGAQTGDVLRLVLVHGARLVGLGLTLGLVGSLMAGRWLQSLLFQTSPHDPITLLAITLFFAGITTFACWLPARHATRISPLEALRTE